MLCVIQNIVIVFAPSTTAVCCCVYSCVHCNEVSGFEFIQIVFCLHQVLEMARNLINDKEHSLDIIKKLRNALSRGTAIIDVFLG
jgi:hypothetical protein